MPSSECTRRRLVACGVGSLTALVAGCTGTDVGETTTAEHNATEGVRTDPTPSDEYDLLTLRSDDAEAIVYPSDDPPDDDDRHAKLSRRRPQFLLDGDDAADLVINSPDEPEARAFIEETDFETESVVVVQRTIEDCYERRVLSVQAGDDNFRTEYCRTLKSPTTPCKADREVMEALFFRVQRAYEDSPSSRSSSESMSCPPTVHDSLDGASETNGSADETTGGATGGEP
ncbi:hypothetical protein [Natrialba sp. INN-245]|uniref:hypothetical protein n=1 Tax=Natrialba sp. INN-245 TaxID=2690967 RepID=UPI0013131A93|nr:hypothetical protein [Natrialba sp. INN-245]MWV41113.1 hypothetical protein [Natrialba sp. INN-245]